MPDFASKEKQSSRHEPNKLDVFPRSTAPENQPAHSLPPLPPGFRHEFGRMRVHPDSASAGFRIQPKLQVGAIDDPLEREADSAADAVMRTADSGPAVVSSASVSPRVQRKCNCGGSCPKCQAKEEDQEPEILQRKSNVPSGPVGVPAPVMVHEALGSPGQPLDSATRAFMEPRFGYDFSSVRVYPESRAAAALRAEAFTYGRQIAFEAGRYMPDTRAGKWLLAHELAHVVQQDRLRASGVTIQRKTGPSKAPDFLGCTGDTALADKPSEELQRALTFARDLVDAALAAIEKNPRGIEKGSANGWYQFALAKHFINPTYSDMKEIYKNYRAIFANLQADNVRCAFTAEDIKHCKENAPKITLAATYPDGRKQPMMVCKPFWLQDLPCRAITLIHEAAHASGIATAPPHPPYVADEAYAKGPAAATAARLKNPDAYAYFAALIGREVDILCTPVEVIEVESPPPAKSAAPAKP